MADDDPFGLGLGGLAGIGIAANGTRNTGLGSIGSSGVSSSSSRDRPSSVVSVERRQLVGDIIDWLRANRGRHDWSVVCESLHIHHTFDAVDQQKLLEELKKNPKATVEPYTNALSYQPQFPNIRNQFDVLDTIQKHQQQHGTGVQLELLLDAYVGIEKDIHKLIYKDRSIYKIHGNSLTQNLNPQDEQTGNGSGPGAGAGAKRGSIPNSITPRPSNPTPTRPVTSKFNSSSSSSSSSSLLPLDSDVYLFPRDASLDLTVSSDIRRLWLDVKMPSSQFELETHLYQNALLTDKHLRLYQLEQSKRAAEAVLRKKKENTNAQKKPRKKYRQKITNTHLIEQLPWLAGNTPGGNNTGAPAQPGNPS